MTFPKTSLDLARRLLGACEARGWRLTTAESCTGGLIVACLTEIPGSSNVIGRGYVTYDNRAKTEMLGVPAPLFERVGAVSEEVARAMAEGALARAGADLALAVTGIAGPGGATPTKPVGLVGPLRPEGHQRIVGVRLVVRFGSDTKDNWHGRKM